MTTKKTALTELNELLQVRPLDEWSEEEGDVLWWKFPINAPPYCGTPHDEDFPDDHDRWSHLPRVWDNDGNPRPPRARTGFEIDQMDLATILGALRYYAHQGLADTPNLRPDWLHDIVCPTEDDTSYCGEQVAELCERLNTRLPLKDEDEQIPSGNVVIYVASGCVVYVDGLPENWTYTVEDEDVVPDEPAEAAQG